MNKLTVIHNIRISEKQDKTLRTLKQKYGINPAHFIRQAISEKLQLEKLEIKESIKIKCPF